MSNVIDICPLLRVKRATADATRRILMAYKAEIYDWCGHELAISEAARKLGLPAINVRLCVDANPHIWS
jgi:hypothetical protein